MFALLVSHWWVLFLRWILVLLFGMLVLLLPLFTLIVLVALFGADLVVLPDAQVDIASRLVEAQSTLATYLVTSRLLLIPFGAPPGRFWAIASDVSGYCRPALLPDGLLLVYRWVLAIPRRRALLSLLRGMQYTLHLGWHP